MRYQKKSPDMIDAIQYKGDNVAEILTFIGTYNSHNVHYYPDGSVYALVVHKPDGNVTLHTGDYICRKVTTDTHNRAYSCLQTIWEENMEPAQEVDA